MALNANTRWECRADATAGNVNGGGFRWINLVSSTYGWTLSGSGTNEYYCRTAAGADPSLSKASCSTDGNFNLATEGIMGSLTAGQWDYGDNDSLGYNTVYVRLTNGTDPDTQPHWTVALGQGGGTDYSQQATAHLTITDLASDGAGKVSSALTPFDAADVGNILHITAAGDGFTTNWYEVTAVDGSAVATLDRSPGLSKTGGTAYLGGAMSLGSTLDGDWGLKLLAGNTVFIKSGSYTLGETITFPDGATNSSFIVTGYNSTRGDDPTRTNRPYINGGSSYFNLGEWNTIKNLRLISTSASGTLYANGGACLVKNCLAINTQTGASTHAFRMSATGSVLIDCEAYSFAQYGASLTYGLAYNCFFHDGLYGVGGTGHVINCIFLHHTTLAMGNTLAGWSNLITNNIFYGDSAATPTCTAGLTLSGRGESVVNNIIQGFTTGIDGVANQYNYNFRNNCFYGNTTNVEAYTPSGTNNVTDNPAMVNPEGTLIHDCEAAWDRVCDADECTVTADATVYKVGTYAAKFACTAAADAAEIIAADAISSTNMSTYNGIAMWVRSSVAMTAGDWQFILSDQANGANAIKTFNFPGLVANTWYWIYFDGGDMSAATAIISLAVKQVVDKGALNFYLDDIRARDCNFTVPTTSPVINAGTNNPFLNMST